MELSVTFPTRLSLFRNAEPVRKKRHIPRSSDQSGWVDAVRGVLHGAMALYLARNLNAPPARLPGEDDDRLDESPRQA